MTRTFEIWRAAPRIRDRDLRPLDLVDACLERIDRLEGRIRAWVLVDREGARRQAQHATDEAARGRYVGPLHGVPIGIKDIIDVEGMPTRAGSQATSSEPAAADAPLVAHLRAAGAIVLGKTTTTELACFDPCETRNPWNERHTPGGSSSGSAAAVAAGMCLAAVGSQTGGSLTRPASYCGVASLKPTHGLVDTTGVVPVSPRLDHVGPIARTAADLVYLLAGMTEASELVELFAQQLRSISAPRLGWVETFFTTEASPPVVDLCCKALANLQAAGATLQNVSLPEQFQTAHVMHRRIMASEAAQSHGQRFAEPGVHCGSELRSLLDEGAKVSQEDYREALAERDRFRQAVEPRLAGLDAWVTPATPTTAPPSLRTTGDPKLNSPWSYAGVPTVSIPCGLAADGLPAALQLIGPSHSEAALLAVAAWCEKQLALTLAPPL